ncbi:MAG: L,D-transpeptidase family protein [Bacteroidales bacterium]|nr:L,D-transpeptidase family protein [Candidatus Physcousia equi]
MPHLSFLCSQPLRLSATRPVHDEAQRDVVRRHASWTRSCLVVLVLLLSLPLRTQNRVELLRDAQKLVVVSQCGDTLLRMPCAIGFATDRHDALTFTIQKIKHTRRWVHEEEAPKDKPGFLRKQTEGAYNTHCIKLKEKTSGRTVLLHGTYLNTQLTPDNQSGCIMVRAAEMERLTRLLSKKSLVVMPATDASALGESDSSLSPTPEQRYLDSLLAQRGNHIVDTTLQHYGYDRMMLDLRLLQRRFPNLLHVELPDTTEQGRPLSVVRFGSPNAKYRVLIQAAMHAREYLTSQLAMFMLEHYAAGYDSLSFCSHSYRQTFDSVAITLLPMVNPDGVEIAQRGAEGTRTDEARRWVQSVVDGGVSHTKIKSNANGVDINRNFACGFGRKTEAEGRKSFFYYEGPQPYSEVESRFMMAVARACAPAAFLNLHSSGNLIYWGAQGVLPAVNERALEMAKLCSALNGYRTVGPEAQTPCGSWADEVMPLFRRPSVTIEVGTRNPVPVAEIHDIFQRNKFVWVAICQWIADMK